MRIEGPDLLVRHAAVGELTSALLHEMASAVQGLQGAADELGETCCGRPDPVRAEAQDNLNHAARRIMEVFSVMRRFCQAARGAPASHSLEALVEQALRLVRCRTRGGSDIEVGDCGRATVQVQDVLIVQVLVTLLQRALDASPPDGQVVVGVAETARKVTLTVADQGAQQSLEQRAAAFDGGEDASLAVAARIVAAHGGHLRCGPAPGGGVCFAMTLPVAQR